MATASACMLLMSGSCDCFLLRVFVRASGGHENPRPPVVVLFAGAFDAFRMAGDAPKQQVTQAHWSMYEWGLASSCQHGQTTLMLTFIARRNTEVCYAGKSTFCSVPCETKEAQALDQAPRYASLLLHNAIPTFCCKGMRLSSALTASALC